LRLVALLAIVAAGSVVLTAVRGDSRAESSQIVVNRAVPIEQAIADLPFVVGRPSRLPFVIEHSYGLRSRLPNGALAVEQTYVGEGATASLTAVDSDVRLVSKLYEITDVSLPNGEPASFMDNGIAQILSWHVGGTGYQLVAKRTGPPFSVFELGEIAVSVR
jgi:hypothetical protein